MKRFLPALVASALLAVPSLALADQTPASHGAAPQHFTVVDERGEVVGALIAVDPTILGLRTIGRVQNVSQPADGYTQTAETRLLTPLDFDQMWANQLEAITRSYPGGDN